MIKKLKQKRINWTLGMSIVSFCLLLTVFIVDTMNEPLFFLKDHKYYHFDSNLVVIVPAFLLSFVLSLIVVIRIVRYWKVWPKRNSKYVILALALPGIIAYLNLLTLLFTT